MGVPYELKITRYRPSGPSARTSACFTVAAAVHFSMGQAELFHVISTRHSILVASPDEAPCQASFLQLCRDFCTLTSDRGTQVCDGWYKIFSIVSVPKVLWEDAWFIFAFHFFCGCIVRVRSVCHVTGQIASLTNLTVMPGTRNLTVSWTAVSGIAAYAADITSTPKTGLARSGPLCECKFRHTPVGSAGSSGRC